MSHGALLGVATLARAIADQPSGQKAMLRPLAALHERLETPNLVSRKGTLGALGLAFGAPNKVQQRIEKRDERRIQAVLNGPRAPQRLLGGDLCAFLDVPRGGVLRKGMGMPC